VQYAFCLLHSVANAQPAMILISTVLHLADPSMLLRHVSALGVALQQLGPSGHAATVVLRDHGPSPACGLQIVQWQAALGSKWPLHYLHSPDNPGYGTGHNRTFAEHGAGCDWFLVLNPDLELRPHSLRHALEFAAAHPHVGLLAPTLDEPEGKRPACFRPPDGLTLLLRALGLTARNSPRIARYECRDWPPDTPVFNPPLCSGCCMLLRRSTWDTLGGFDPGFFLYFEDFELSGRAGRLGLSAWCPGFLVQHSGGGAARKDWLHRWWFVRSGFRYQRKQAALPAADQHDAAATSSNPNIGAALPAQAQPK